MLHHQGMGCNKYGHQCSRTDAQIHPCPTALSKCCISHPRRTLLALNGLGQIKLHQSLVNNVFVRRLDGAVLFSPEWIFPWVSLFKKNKKNDFSSQSQQMNITSLSWESANVWNEGVMFCKLSTFQCQKKKGSQQTEKKNSPGSVRTTSCSTAAVICASGNDLCHSASNWDLTLQLTHMLFIAITVISLENCVSTATPLCWEKRKEFIPQGVVS